MVHIVQAYNIFGDKAKAIEVCVNRFDDETKQAFLELYDKVDADFVMPKRRSNRCKHLTLTTSLDKMTNAWSLLYDVMTTKADGYSTNEDGIVGGLGEDTICIPAISSDALSQWADLDETTMDYTVNIPDLPNAPDNNNGRWKYNEDVILKDIHEYVSGTYRSHYTGNEGGFKDIQTIDLMEVKNLASNFCQNNILKYGSRYGDKDGKNKKDLLKVIHYAMLLLHFDDHYKSTNSDFPY